MSTDALCEQVVTPPPAVPPQEVVVDPTQARVVRARTTTTTTSTSTTTTTAAPSAEILNLENYYYRPQEGLRGRWYVSIVATGSRDDRRVRPTPLQFDVGKDIQLTPLLEDGTLEGVINISGSSTYLSSQQLKTELEWSKSHNPHRSIVSNGLIVVAPSGSNPQYAPRARVGCSLPKLSINPNGFYQVFNEQTELLFSAGVQTLSWIYETANSTLQIDDLVKQLRWTMNANTASVSGSWSFRTLDYLITDYDAFATELKDTIIETSQPGNVVTTTPSTDSNSIVPVVVVSGTPLTLNVGNRAEFIKKTAEVWNKIIGNTNDIRVLHGLEPAPQYVISAWVNTQTQQQLSYTILSYSTSDVPSGGDTGLIFTTTTLNPERGL